MVYDMTAVFGQQRIVPLLSLDQFVIDSLQGRQVGLDGSFEFLLMEGDHLPDRHLNIGEKGFLMETR